MVGTGDHRLASVREGLKVKGCPSCEDPIVSSSVKHCAVYDFTPINSRDEAGVTEVKWLASSVSNFTLSEPWGGCFPYSAWVTLLRCGGC